MTTNPTRAEAVMLVGLSFVAGLMLAFAVCTTTRLMAAELARHGPPPPTKIVEKIVERPLDPSAAGPTGQREDR